MAGDVGGRTGRSQLDRLEGALAELALTATGDAGDVVVLLDADGQPAGTADRLSTHTGHTPLHLAFSCYLFDDRGRVLLTRRALSKCTWPGVWTNSCCGHPRPGDTFAEAISRRLSDELGTGIEGLWCVLPDFRYRAVDASGVVENEVCPVFVGRHDGTPLEPDPAEVMDWTWVAWRDLALAAAGVPTLLSPWSALQIPLLDTSVSQRLALPAQTPTAIV